MDCGSKNSEKAQKFQGKMTHNFNRFNEANKAAKPYPSSNQTPKFIEAQIKQEIQDDSMFQAIPAIIGIRPIHTCRMLSGFEHTVNQYIETSAALRTRLIDSESAHANEKADYEAKLDQIRIQLFEMKLERDIANMKAENVKAKITDIKNQILADYTIALTDNQTKLEEQHNKVLAEMGARHVIELKHSKDQSDKKIEELKKFYNEKMTMLEANQLQAKSNFEMEHKKKYQNVVINIQEKEKSERAKLLEKKSLCTCCKTEIQSKLFCSEQCRSLW